MGWNGRKVVVGLLALGGLLGVFVLYTHVSQVPALTDARNLLPPLEDEADLPTDEEVGTVAGVGIGRVEQTQFLHTDEYKRVDREFGFEELLHTQGNQWEILRPYMKLFLPAFRCDVTADRGTVQLQTVSGRPMPSDADFSGNVVIHVIPSEPNDPWECFIHLDTVEFLAEKSLFSTAGPVRFLSRNARLTGTGMELVYDQGRARVELFRVFDLDDLRLRGSAFGSVDRLASPARGTGGSAESAVAKPPANPEPRAAGDSYQCVFRRNVTIQTPKGTVVLQDVLVLNNLLWSKAGARDHQDSEPNRPAPPARANQKALNTNPPSLLALDAVPEDFFDVVVTCEGGCVVAPTGTLDPMADPAQSPRAAKARGVASRAPALPPDRQYATAERGAFDAFTTDTVLAGPVEMMFYIDPNGLGGGKTGGPPLPMTVTAGQSVRFLAASRQILLEGDCKVTLCRSEPNLRYEYTLTAPRLTLDLVSDPNRKGEAAVTVSKMVAAGGPAAVRILKTDAERTLGWTTLEAAELQYRAGPREFTAVGPGQIWMRNDEALDPNADPNQLSLNRPCYARLTHFDTLTYSAFTGRIVATDQSQQLLLDYFPLTAGRYGRHIQMVAGHVEASLKERAGGRMDLDSLTASKGVEYEDERSHFIGSTLFYDNTRSLVTVKGDDVLPCYLNGALVDEIEADLKTGRVKTEFPTPSLLQVRR